MDPKDRENHLYETGKRVEIKTVEELLLSFFNVRSKKGFKGIDIGCGTGEITNHMMEAGYDCVGFDFSPVAIELASQSFACNFDVCDLDSGIPAADNKVDYIWATDIIEHVFDPSFVMEECSRVLKPGGYLYLSAPYDLHIANRFRACFGISHQLPIYEKHGQCKHHSIICWNLMRYFLSKGNFQIEDYAMVHRIPLLNKYFNTKNFHISFFGNEIVLVARNEK